MNNTSSTSPGTPSKTTPPPAQNVTPPPEQKVQHLETSPQLKSPANVKESPSPVVDVKSPPIKTVEAATPEVSKVETLEPKAETDSTAENEAKTRRTTRSSKGRSQEEIQEFACHYRHFPDVPVPDSYPGGDDLNPGTAPRVLAPLRYLAEERRSARVARRYC